MSKETNTPLTADKKRIAMNIVNQLFDIAEVPVKKRQEINDVCDDFVITMLDKFLPPPIDKEGFSDDEIFKEGVKRASNQFGIEVFPMNRKWFVKGAKWMRDKLTLHLSQNPVAKYSEAVEFAEWICSRKISPHKLNIKNNTWSDLVNNYTSEELYQEYLKQK